MNAHLVDDIAQSVLYDGYILYPYRPTALRNRQRFNCGVVVPPLAAHSREETSAVETECVVQVSSAAVLEVRVRFLHLAARRFNGSDWNEAIERVVTIDTPVDLDSASLVHRTFAWPASRTAGHVQEPLSGQIELAVDVVRPSDHLFKITMRIANTTPLSAFDEPAAIQKRSFISTHAVFHIEGGTFLSLVDPPPGAETIAASCRNVGLWPVIVGEAGTADAMLAAPVILHDHPQIATEDTQATDGGPDIEEMLALRILTLTDEEKQHMCDGDVSAQLRLEETERLSGEQLMRRWGGIPNFDDVNRI